MTIDKAIPKIQFVRNALNNDMGIAKAYDLAINTMRKYQKIQEILNSASYVENGTEYSYTYDEDTRVKHIREVIEDENNKKKERERKDFRKLKSRECI